MVEPTVRVIDPNVEEADINEREIEFAQKVLHSINAAMMEGGEMAQYQECRPMNTLAAALGMMIYTKYNREGGELGKYISDSVIIASHVINMELKAIDALMRTHPRPTRPRRR